MFLDAERVASCHNRGPLVHIYLTLFAIHPCATTPVPRSPDLSYVLRLLEFCSLQYQTSDSGYSVVGRVGVSPLLELRLNEDRVVRPNILVIGLNISQTTYSPSQLQLPSYEFVT